MKIHKKKIIDTIAQQEGVSPEKVCKEIEFAIQAARNNPDSKKWANFRKLFEDYTPSPRKFLLDLTKLYSK